MNFVLIEQMDAKPNCIKFPLAPICISKGFKIQYFIIHYNFQVDRKSWSILILLFTSLENTVFHNQREYKNRKRIYTHQFSDSVMVRHHHFQFDPLSQCNWRKLNILGCKWHRHSWKEGLSPYPVLSFRILSLRYGKLSWA